MLNQSRTRFRPTRFAAVGAMVLLLLAAAPFAAAAGSEGAISYSGDDDYDPAAFGILEISLLAFAGGSLASCDDGIASN